MSNGKAGRPPRSGTIIKIRVSDNVLKVYFPALKERYPRADRSALGGIVLDAAAEARLLLPEPPAEAA